MTAHADRDRKGAICGDSNAKLVGEVRRLRRSIRDLVSTLRTVEFLLEHDSDPQSKEVQLGLIKKELRKDHLP